MAVFVDGVLVVDLVGGWADAARTRRWQPDTLVDVYSVGKAMVALLVLQLVDEGRLGLDDPVTSVWPEFGAGGKEGATVRHALCHRAGVPAIRRPLTNQDLWDWDTMTTALAATEAWWVPGTRHAYHTNTYGHLVGELVRRVGGDLPGDRLAALAGPLGADVWCGLPVDEQARCAEVIWEFGGSTPVVDYTGMTGDELMVNMGYVNPPGYSSMGVANTAEWRTAQVPSTNTHGTATGIARIYRALLEPGLLLLPRPVGRGHLPPVGGLLPGTRRGGHLRARVHPDHVQAPVRSQPVGLRPFRDRRGGGLRRPRRRRGLRLRHEPRDPPLAVDPEPVAGRRGLRLPLTGRAGRAPDDPGGTAVWQSVGVHEARP